MRGIGTDSKNVPIRVPDLDRYTPPLPRYKLILPNITQWLGRAGSARRYLVRTQSTAYSVR